MKQPKVPFFIYILQYDLYRFVLINKLQGSEAPDPWCNANSTWKRIKLAFPIYGSTKTSKSQLKSIS